MLPLSSQNRLEYLSVDDVFVVVQTDVVSKQLCRAYSIRMGFVFAY